MTPHHGDKVAARSGRAAGQAKSQGLRPVIKALHGARAFFIKLSTYSFRSMQQIVANVVASADS